MCQKHVQQPQAVAARHQGRMPSPWVLDECHQIGRHALSKSHVRKRQYLLVIYILIQVRFALSNIWAAVSSRISKKGCMACKQWLSNTSKSLLEREDQAS